MPSTMHPLLHYKPGLTMDEPIAVTIAAADWIAFLTWAATTEAPGHIIYGMIAPQVSDAVYTPESIQAARDHDNQRHQIVGSFHLPFPGNPMTLFDDVNPEDITGEDRS